MTPETWLDELAHELTVRHVGADDAMQAVVEAQAFLADSDGDPLVEFGSPGDYALRLATSLRPSAPPRSGRGAKTLVMADSLWKSFGKHHVLRDFSVVLRAGSVSVLIGANGAGKSTLMRILAGLLAPDSGTVWAECSVGYSPQAPSLNDYLTPVEHVRLFGTAAGMSQEVASRAGARLAECLGWDLAKESVCGSLSGGTRQKLNVVLAGLHTPEVILLDEPHQGLDYESSAMLWDLIAAWRDQGKHVLVASHIREAIVHADTVIEVPRLSKE